jgi:hypothetical protein
MAISSPNAYTRNLLNFRLNNDPIPAYREYAGRDPTTQDAINAELLDGFVNTSTGVIWFLTQSGGVTEWVPVNAASTNTPTPFIPIFSSTGLSVNTGYNVYSGAAPIFLTLPTVSTPGQIIIIIGSNLPGGSPPASPGWRIIQGVGQSITQGQIAQTSVGAAGSLVAPIEGLSLTLECLVANTIWSVQNMSGGSFIFF